MRIHKVSPQRRDTLTQAVSYTRGVVQYLLLIDALTNSNKNASEDDGYIA
jgi:hypothetical protein